MRQMVLDLLQYKFKPGLGPKQLSKLVIFAGENDKGECAAVGFLKHLRASETINRGFLSIRLSGM